MARTLKVTWSRGTPRMVPDFGPNYDQEGLPDKPFYPGDSPTSHPRFADAKLEAGEWVWIRRASSTRDGEYLADDVVRHLRTWGVTPKVVLA